MSQNNVYQNDLEFIHKQLEMTLKSEYGVDFKDLDSVQSYLLLSLVYQGSNSRYLSLYQEFFDEDKFPKLYDLILDIYQKNLFDIVKYNAALGPNRFYLNRNFLIEFYNNGKIGNEEVRKIIKKAYFDSMKVNLSEEQARENLEQLINNFFKEAESKKRKI